MSNILWYTNTSCVFFHQLSQSSVDVDCARPCIGRLSRAPLAILFSASPHPDLRCEPTQFVTSRNRVLLKAVGRRQGVCQTLEKECSVPTRSLPLSIFLSPLSLSLSSLLSPLSSPLFSSSSLLSLLSLFSLLPYLSSSLSLIFSLLTYYYGFILLCYLVLQFPKTFITSYMHCLRYTQGSYNDKILPFPPPLYLSPLPRMFVCMSASISLSLPPPLLLSPCLSPRLSSFYSPSVCFSFLLLPLLSSPPTLSLSLSLSLSLCFSVSHHSSPLFPISFLSPL